MLLRGCKDPPAVKVWMEVCSVYAHRPADRTVLQQLIAALKPGDCVVAAAPDRIARNVTDLCWVLQQLHDRHTAMLVAAIGQHAEVPLVVLGDGGHGWCAEGTELQHTSSQQDAPVQQQQQQQPGSVSDSESLVMVMDLSRQVLPAVCVLLKTVCWATSAQQAVISASHALMAGQLHMHAVGHCGAVTDLMSVLVQDCEHIMLFTRVSNNPPHQGGAQGLAGSVRAADMQTESLSRQQRFCALAIG
jgi:hypothetical protein